MPDATEAGAKQGAEMSRKRIVVALIAAVAMTAFPITAIAAEPLDPVASDPVALGWMKGAPPPIDKRVTAQDGGHLQFPRTRWAFSHMRELLPSRSVAAAPRASRLPTALRADLDAVTFTPMGGGASMTWAQAMQATYADGVIVLHRGRVVHERYFGITTAQTPHILFSVTKSFVGTLIEGLIADGVIDENALLSRYVPELASSGFGDATIRQTLDMTTALDFSEAYTDPRADIARLAIASGAVPAPPNYPGPRTIDDFLPTVPKKGEHGQVFTYRSANTEALGWVVARVTGRNVADLISERLLAPMGAERDGDMLVDSTGAAMAAGGLNLTLRDLARFGELMRNKGRLGGKQIVPESVVAKIEAGADKTAFAAAKYATLTGWSYKSQWWVSHDSHGAYMARGIHGQALYIDPKAEMVIARFASHPVAGNVANDPISLPAYRAMADALAGGERR